MTNVVTPMASDLRTLVFTLTLCSGHIKMKSSLKGCLDQRSKLTGGLEILPVGVQLKQRPRLSQSERRSASVVLRRAVDKSEVFWRDVPHRVNFSRNHCAAAILVSLGPI